MNTTTSTRTYVVASNFSLAVVFGLALIQPEHHLDFIFRIAPLLFIFEFLSIHAAGILTGSIKLRQLSANPAAFQFLAKLYVGSLALIVIALGVIQASWQLPVGFLVSLSAKFFSGKAAPSPSRVRAQALLLVTSFLTAGLLAKPLSQSLLNQNEILVQSSQAATSIWVGNPQILLVWGILFFLSLATLEFFFSRKARIQQAHGQLSISRG